MDEVLGLRNEHESSHDSSKDNHKLSYYEALLEDLQQMETEINCSFPKLKNKMDTLRFEVRYIMPYMTCHVVTSAEAFEETKRRFRIEGRPKRLIKFVEHMIEQTLLDKPNAIDFYHDTCVGEYNWGAFTDCVLENLKYAQGLDDNNDAAKSIEESLRFVRNFVMLVENRKFGRLNNINNEIRDIHESMVSVSRDAALILQLFMADNYDGLNDAMTLRISKVQEKSNSASLEAEETYYDILSLLKFSDAWYSWPVNCVTLYGLIDSLQKDLIKVLTDLHLVKLSREEDIRDMLNEMEFLKCILSRRSSDGMIDLRKLEAIAAHVDVLAFEAESAVYASEVELRDLDDHKMHTKITCLSAKINQTTRELRQANITDWSSMNVLDHIEEPEVINFYRVLIGFIEWQLGYCKQPCDETMLETVNCLGQLLEGMSRTDANVVIYLKYHFETVLRNLTVLKCILTDLRMHYYEEQEYDELVNDIGAGMAKASVLFFISRVLKSKMKILFGVNDAVRFLSVTVSQLYLKYIRLSLLELPFTEMGSLNILFANLKKMTKCTQFRELGEDLQVCNLFLRNSNTSSNQYKLEVIKGLRTRILSLGRKLENALEIFGEVPDWFFEMRISSFTEEVKVIAKDIKDTKLRLSADDDGLNTTPKVEAKPLKVKVIGFEDVEEQLIKQLTIGSQLLEVISIVGMPGLGKTTLVMKVYEAVADSFHCSAWCYVSQNYQKKRLLQQILNDIEGPSVGINELSDEDVALKLYQCLMKKKDYLIVLDDVWDIEVWDELRMCFPQGSARNRILLTSRSKVVGLHAASSGDPCISLNLLSTENGRLLLENNIFGARGFPEHLREIGVEIADRCGRLPLSLVLTAGVLMNLNENKKEWEQVAKNLNSFVQSQDGVLNTLELSYKHLPDHLKQCFLYCVALMSTPISRGEICRSKLVQLWVAERFIDETNEHRSLDLEEAAECCLMDLISRSLLIVSKITVDGQFHSCRVHDLLRDFCLQKVLQQEFWLTSLDISKPFPTWQQRVSICLGSLSKVEYPKWSRLHTRSLIHPDCLSGCIHFNHGDFSYILDRFPLLNVLDLERANMGDFPESIIEMRQLRYLAIRGSMNFIPSSINKLSHLETLIIQGGKDGIRIPDTVFGLKKLRHLTVRPYIHFPTTSLSPSDCLQLQTLATFIICHCEACKDAINRLPNLRKLRCIFHGSIRYDGFPALDSLNCLESVEASYSGLSPLFFKFIFPILPTSLKFLSLSKFELPWSEMEKIAALPCVEYLVLFNRAFSGKKWATQNEFPSLKYLRLESLDVEEWEASDDHFPCLERLIVRGCKRLKEIPPEFSNAGTLSCIRIDECGRSVGDSAIKIEYEQKNYSGNRRFKAIISRIQEMVFNEEQANKEFYLSLGVFLAFQFVLFMSMGMRTSQ